MNYIVKTLNAKALIDSIISCVKAGKDTNSSDIQSWGIKKTASGTEVLVHTPQQWAEKGCVRLKSNKTNDEIEVFFHYWTTCPDDLKNDNDEGYILGRFTELLLVHFWNDCVQINIK